MVKLTRALLIVNPHKANARTLADEIKRELSRREVEVSSFAFEDKGEFRASGAYDLCFSLGGDGTVLYAARAMAPLGVPLFPINLGSLGFIAAVHPHEWSAVFDRWIAGTAVVSRRLMLEVWVERRGRIINRGNCLNDVVVSALGIAKIIRLNVEAETAGDPLSGTSPEYIRFGHYRSDGLIVATPTGSTAYSVAAGGPLLAPEREAVINTPLCPFTLSNRPMVVPAHETMMVELEAEQRSGVLLTIDGQETETLEPNDRIYIRRSPCQALLIASDRRMFYKALRTKLNWSGFSGPDPLAAPPDGGGGSHA
jgi:NAD+ kinase